MRATIGKLNDHRNGKYHVTVWNHFGISTSGKTRPDSSISLR